MESDEMSEEDDCPPFECEIKCLVFLEDDYGCKTCACDRTNEALLEGDIRIDPSTIKDVEIAYGIQEDPHGIMRGGTDDNSRRWVDYPSGGNYIIPYYYNDEDFTSSERDNFAAALQEIEDASCLRFRERTNQHYYLRFVRGPGCYSYIGNMRTSGGQEISLGSGCLYTRGVAQHEVLHALGFWHEQSRKDRDNYVTILTQNIMPGFEGQFSKINTESFGSPYDFDSVMHYPNNAFTKNGEDTIQAKSNPFMEFGQRVKFSTEDIKQLQRMYQCDGPVTTTTSTTTTPTTAAPTTAAPTTAAPTTATPTTATPTTATPTTATPTTATPTTATPTTATPTTITPTTTTSTPCTDRRRRRRCRKLRRRGHCNRKSVERKCAKTCGLCE